MGEACTAHEGNEKCLQHFAGKLEGKRPLGRPRRRWENIKMDITEIGRGDVDWIHLAQGRHQ